MDGKDGDKEKKVPRAKAAAFNTKRWTTLWILGIDETTAGMFVGEQVKDRLAKLGVSANFAPNSILLKNAECDKALPLNHMLPTLAYNSIAFGDNPSGNDAPLTKFGDRGIPFVSVSTLVDETPENLRSLFVGSLEIGTARCLEYMNERRSCGGVAAPSMSETSHTARY